MDIYSRVVYTNRHKYICGKSDDMDIFYDTEKSVKLDSMEPVVVNVINESLDEYTKYLNNKKVSLEEIEMFHRNYYDFLIAVNVIETLINSIDINILNDRLKDMIEYYNNINSECEIKDVLGLALSLMMGLYYYKEEYYNYLDKGIYRDRNILPIREVNIEGFLLMLKRLLGIDNHFSIILDCCDNKNMSILCKKTINSYMNMDCNNVFCINVLNDMEMDVYNDLDGNLVGYLNNCSMHSMEQYKNYCNNIDNKDIKEVAKKLILEKKDI